MSSMPSESSADPLIREKTVNVNGMSFSIKCWGEEGAPVILALHGWLDNASSYDLLAPLLKDYQVYALDLAGHGRSSHRPVGVPYHFVDYVADGFYVAKALGLESFHLMGHSLGANVATTMAGAIPEKIKSLILIEGFGPATREVSETAQLMRESIEKFSETIGSVETKKPHYVDFEVLVKARLGGRWPLTEWATRRLCERGSVEKEGKYTWSSDARIMYTSPLRMNKEQAKVIRESITSPCKVIIAEQGIAPLMNTYMDSLSQIKDADVSRVDGFHHLHMEDDHVEEVAEIINSFLS